MNKAARVDKLKSGLVLICFLGIAILQAEISQRVHQSSPLLSAGGRYWGEYINTRMVKRFLGLRVVTADLIWIDLLYKSDLKHESDYSPFYKATRSILDLDPQNYLAVWFSGVYLSVIKDDIQGASHIFKDATEALEKDTWVNDQTRGSIYFAYSYHLLFEENDAKTAAVYMQKAAEGSGATVLAKQMAKTLSTQQGQIELGFRVLNDLYKRMKTDEEKKRVEVKMKALLHRKDLLDLNEQFEKFRLNSDSTHLPLPRLYLLFLRSINHKGVDLLGRKLILDASGHINSTEATQ